MWSSSRPTRSLDDQYVDCNLPGLHKLPALALANLMAQKSNERYQSWSRISTIWEGSQKSAQQSSCKRQCRIQSWNHLPISLSLRMDVGMTSVALPISLSQESLYPRRSLVAGWVKEDAVVQARCGSRFEWECVYRCKERCFGPSNVCASSLMVLLIERMCLESHGGNKIAV